MAKRRETPARSPAEQLDRALETMMTGTGATRARLSPAIEELLSIAAELRGLPRAGFKERLAAGLTARAVQARMPQTDAPPAGALPADGFIPQGLHTATSCLVLKDPAEAIEFYKKGFGAIERMRLRGRGGRILHAEIQIGDSIIALAAEEPGYNLSPAALGGSAVITQLYVEDVDRFAERAIAAGAKVIFPVADQFYGDRSGRLADPFGHLWIVATHKEDLSMEEMQRRAQARADAHRAAPPAQVESARARGAASSYRAQPHLFVHDAAGLMDFLKRAFGADEISCHRLPDGLIAHAEMRIGDSTIGVGDATGEATPMPAMFHLQVDDPDVVYRRALAAGGVSLSEPADQPWGLRSAGVRDSGGNQWWVNAPIARSDASESSSAVGAAPPPNLNPVMPFMFIRAAAEAVEFYKNVFGARELMRETEPGGIVSHAQFQIGQSLFMISNPASQDVSASGGKKYTGTPHELGGSPLHLYLQVPDVDRVFDQAIAAGAKVLHSVNDQEWGDRVGGFEDPFGHVWYVATPLTAARRADDE